MKETTSSALELARRWIFENAVEEIPGGRRRFLGGRAKKAYYYMPQTGCRFFDYFHFKASEAIGEGLVDFIVPDAQLDHPEERS